jgi:hypothetical protein
LPGNETSLNEEQIKQAFYDAMPSTWRKRYIQAGHLSVLMTIAQLLRYFCQQEHLAIQKQGENQSSQRSQHKTSITKHRFTPKGSVKESTTEKRFSGSASKSNQKQPLASKLQILHLVQSILKWDTTGEIVTPMLIIKSVEILMMKKTNKTKTSQQALLLQYQHLLTRMVITMLK